MSLFASFVSKYPPQKPLMPFIHNTSVQNLHSIIIDGTIRPMQCPVFKENFTYLFYGRPAYSSIHALLPVSLLLKPEIITNSAKKIFPFDSGAFYYNIYKDITSKFDINEFNLGESVEEIQKLITAFFGTNKNYYYGRTIYESNSSDSMQVAEYHRLIETESTADHRRFTAEIIIDYNIVLKDNLLAIILPFNIMDIKNINKELIKNNYGVYLYHTINGFNLMSFNFELFTIVGQILNTDKYF